MVPWSLKMLEILTLKVNFTISVRVEDIDDSPH